MRALVVSLLLAGCVAPAAVTPSPEVARLLPTAPGLHALEIDVGGETALGAFGVPEGGNATALVVFAHGYGGDRAYVDEVVEDYRALGAFTVGMEYRGDVDDYKVRTGVEDTLAATRLVLAEHPEIDLVVAYGHSMGGEITGLVVAQAEPGTFDYWIDGSGVMDLADEWAKMPYLAPPIMEETGGTPFQVPDEYAARSPLDHVEAIAAHGLKRVYIVHGATDPIVPYEHAERMYAALQDAGVPVTLYEAKTGEESLPAGHEVGLWSHVRPLVEHRVQRLGDVAEPAVHGTYDGTARTYEPSDVP